MSKFVKGKPVVIMEWKGTDPHLKSILLNSHTDVVPVEPVSYKLTTVNLIYFFRNTGNMIHLVL